MKNIRTRTPIVTLGFLAVGMCLGPLKSLNAQEVQQQAFRQTLTSGTVKSFAQVSNNRLWRVEFKEQIFVAYATSLPTVGKEVAIEIIVVEDIGGNKHTVAYVMHQAASAEPSK
jgi:hypothetical protein